MREKSDEDEGCLQRVMRVASEGEGDKGHKWDEWGLLVSILYSSDVPLIFQK